MKIEYIYWFANFNLSSPSVRYRGQYPLEFLKNKYNINSSFIYPSYKFKIILKFINIIFKILFFRKKNSIIVIENVYTKRIYSTILKILLFFKNKHTLYDIDDAEYERFEAETIIYFMKKCKACSVGSQVLMNYTNRFNKNTFLLTSPVIQHNIIKKKRNKILTIGWIGFFSAHSKSLYNLFFPSLMMIDFPIKLIILGIKNKKDKMKLINYYTNNKNIKIKIYENIDWLNEIDIYKKIVNFDIGITTLLNNELNQAKSAFKLKQYMSCGVPVLGSNTGENAKFLRNKFNGYYCNNAVEFKNKIIEIQKLSNNEYFKLSSNSIKTFYEFNMENYCKTLLNFYGKNNKI